MQQETKSERRAAIRDEQRRWLETVTSRTGLSLSEIAKRAGKHHTTITRFYHNPDVKTLLSPMTLSLISSFSGVPTPGAITAEKPTGFHEKDAAFKSQPDSKSEQYQILEPIMRGRPNAHIWTINNNSLLLAGVKSGDQIVVDMAETPQDGDVVCAQVEHSGQTSTVFRVYQNPYIISAGTDIETTRPELVDNRRVRVMGVMIALLRTR